MRNILLILLFVFPDSLRVFGQGTPEKFSSEFINFFLNYKEGCVKNFISADTVEQKMILAKLKSLHTNNIKPDLKGKLLSSSARAVLKDGDTRHKQIADIFIQITDSKMIKYELPLWSCCLQDGKWLLGDKIELNKL